MWLCSKKINKKFQNSDNPDKSCFQASSHILFQFSFSPVLRWFLIQKWGKDVSFPRGWGKEWTQEWQQRSDCPLGCLSVCLSVPDGNPDCPQVIPACLRKDLGSQMGQSSACPCRRKMEWAWEYKPGKKWEFKQQHVMHQFHCLGGKFLWYLWLYCPPVPKCRFAFWVPLEKYSRCASCEAPWSQHKHLECPSLQDTWIAIFKGWKFRFSLILLTGKQTNKPTSSEGKKGQALQVQTFILIPA